MTTINIGGSTQVNIKDNTTKLNVGARVSTNLKLEDLIDIDSYDGNAGKFLKVNATEDGADWSTSTASLSWGDIGGTLSDQTDLQNALDNADKTYTQAFVGVSVVNVIHNLGKRPAVTVVDSAGSKVDSQVDYVDSNNLTVTFDFPFSGVVYCN